MNLTELNNLLDSNNIRKDAYSLKGGMSNEAYCIEIKNGIWQVYYSERGLMTSLREFETEDEACTHFYQWIMSDTLVKAVSK